VTPLALATLALYAAAGLAAVVSRSRPVAAYLGAVLAIDGLRWCQALLLPSPPELRTGWWLVTWWLEVGLYTGSMLALPAMAWVLFRARPRARARALTTSARRCAPRTEGQSGASPAPPATASALSTTSRPAHRLVVPCPPDRQRWPEPESFFGKILLGWLLLTAWIAGSYPALRGPALLRVYDWIELGAVVVALTCVGWWTRSGFRNGDQNGSFRRQAKHFRALRVAIKSPTPAHLAGLALIAGPAATNLVAWFPGGDVLASWRFVVAANAVAVAAALVLLLWGLTRARGRRCTS
jgi:hypothetical protein